MTTASLPQAAPPEGREAVEGLAGASAAWELRTNRGGAQVWRVTGPAGRWALKIGREGAAAVVAREATVLERIEPQVSATSYGAHAESGRTDEAAWLITPWFDGPSTWERFRSVRDGNADNGQALAAAIDLCTAVGSMHQAGWVHGDVQPHHSLHMPQGARLIDCSWAWSMRLPPSYASEGGLVHLTSRDLMARAASSQRPVATSQPDEVYAVAASLWWAATNSWPLDYAKVGIDPDRFTATELRGVLVRNPVPFGRIERWPRLEEVLRAVLTVDVPQRPSALQLAQWLRGIGAQ
jgi:hypothetical protein